MDSLETAIRLLVIGQQVLLALVCLPGDGNRSARTYCALLLASVAAYLVASDPVLYRALSAVSPLIVLLSISVPYLLWAFARAVFDAPRPPIWIVVGVAVLVAVEWVLLTGIASVGEQLYDLVFAAKRIVAIGIVLHVMWITVSGRVDDLMEKRRRFRVIFVVLISLQAIGILLVELVIGTTAAPAWLSLLNVVMIGLLTTGLALAVVRLDTDFIPSPTPDGAVERVSGEAGLNAAERILKDRLLGAMSDGIYCRTGLTIRELAAELGYPEHQLRKLINRHLGFRNFSAFLNSYRVEAAKTRLASEDDARTPVLTIALDLGYASLGPFNRAFKAATGRTPSEYRESLLGSGADSE